MEEKFESYDFIAKDGTRHQDMKSVRRANEIYWEYTHPKKINQTKSREFALKTGLGTQFKEKFKLATGEMTMISIYFGRWDSYCTLLMDAVNSGVVSLQDIVQFAHNLRSASVKTITIPEHEEYLRSIKVLDLLIDTISCEQDQVRR